MRHPSNMASKSVPFPRVDRQPVLHLYRQHAPGEPTLVVLRLPFGRVLGDLVVALQAPGRARSGGSATAAAIAAQSVVLPAPAGTVKPCSAAGGLFEAESCHRRGSRSRSVLPPAAPSTLRTKARP